MKKYIALIVVVVIVAAGLLLLRQRKGQLAQVLPVSILPAVVATMNLKAQPASLT